MPNQLAESKKRKTIAEHAAVLDALDYVAEAEGTTSTELMRQAARDLVRDRLQDERLRDQLRHALRRHAPMAPKRFKSAAQLARYKVRLREYDALCLELGLDDPSAVQRRNSIHTMAKRPALVSSL